MLSHKERNRKLKNYSVAFSLAEVLITLGIVGVIATITLPTLIQNYKNLIVESKLQKVYSEINQAISQSEIVNGEKESWDFNNPNFLDIYILPYLKYLKTEKIISYYKYQVIYFNNGSILIAKISGQNLGMNQDYFYYPNAKYFDVSQIHQRNMSGTTMFEFRFAPNDADLHYHKGFEPYMHDLYDYNVAKIKSGYIYSCSKANTNFPIYCTALIARNGWKIPKDYPFRVK